MRTKEELIRFCQRRKGRLDVNDEWPLLRWFPYEEVKDVITSQSLAQVSEQFGAVALTPQNVEHYATQAVEKGLAYLDKPDHGNKWNHVNLFKALRAYSVILGEDELATELDKAFKVSMYCANTYALTRRDLNLEVGPVGSNLSLKTVRLISNVSCEPECPHCARWEELIEKGEITVPSV